jgi:Ca2+-binding RTX toxin-like protein
MPEHARHQAPQACTYWRTCACTGTGPPTPTLNLICSAGNDVLVGNNSANNYSGGYGNDRILASAGKDSISGGAGVDTLD